jgi:hypothetical protein
MARLASLLLLALCCVLPWPASANNDVIPRLYTNVPVGLNFLGVSFTRSEGNVAVDPALALDVDATLDTYAVTYSRSFAAFGQSALFTAVLPYADLTLTGIVGGAQVTASGDGMPDPHLRLAMNLAGAPALAPAEMAGYRQKTIIGFSIDVTVPVGDYDDTRRVNFGSNRWTVAPEIGVGRRLGRFSVEGSLSAILFSPNHDYLVSSTLEQEPIGVARANLIYHFQRPGTWLGVSALYLKGGETSIDGVKRADLQSNSRVGIALSVPFARRHNVLLRYSNGVTTRIGADFDNYQVQYTLRF